jgi:hypothetical protein
VRKTLLPLTLKQRGYFFVYPLGHAGLVAVTFLVVLPLMQVIVFLAIGAGEVFLVTSGVACGAGAS